MSTVIPPTILVIIGVTGDLSTRKLLPALNQILKTSIPAETTRVIGVTRRPVTAHEILQSTQGDTSVLAPVFETYQMSLVDKQDYKKLATYLEDVKRELGKDTQTIFYLSIPPQTAQPVVELLGESGIAESDRTKLLLEKPFGIDLSSARELVTQTRSHFKESQIYRIDHYLAKEMTQNLVVFRQKNSLFRHTWNKDFVERIEVVASEKIGIEGRAVFYEQTGALRDLIQSHLLQLAALTLADLREDGRQTIPARRLKALQALQTPQDIDHDAIRGQYRDYRSEVDNPDSTVETFVSLTLQSSDPTWQGVPIVLTTGKALDKKTTEIRITYKQCKEDEANTLTLRIQPDEGAELELWAKRPGYDSDVAKTSLGFTYARDVSVDALPEAYERVFMDAIRSDHSLFTTSDEVLETWRILEPVQQAWQMDGDDLRFYPYGATPESIKNNTR